jgi:hypothetical protein
MKRALGRLLLLVTIAVITDQIVLRLLLADGEVAGKRLAPYHPPIFNSTQRDILARYEESLASGQPVQWVSVIDPDLGWLPNLAKKSKLYVYDPNGARIGSTPIPRERANDVSLAVAMGCSFTRGDEVQGAETWTARVDDARVDLQVANLGVGGYGLDQALLRLRRDGLPMRPDEVWFGWLPSATLRVTTLFPPIYNHNARTVAFKPCFVLKEDGDLRLLPNPAPTLEQVVSIISDPARLLEAVGPADHWVQRAPAAYSELGSSWLHHSACGRMLLTVQERGDREPAPWLSSPGSKVFGLYRALILEMQREAHQAGARFRVWVLPCSPDLRAPRVNGSPYWSKLADTLRSDGVEVFDLTATIEAGGGAERAELWAPYGHYSAESNRVIAQALLEYLSTHS